MNRGMITLSFPALQRLQTWAADAVSQGSSFPDELRERLEHIEANVSPQQLEISEYTADALIDLLPPPHTISDAVELEISSQFRNFLLAIRAINKA